MWASQMCESIFISTSKFVLFELSGISIDFSFPIFHFSFDTLMLADYAINITHHFFNDSPFFFTNDLLPIEFKDGTNTSTAQLKCNQQ